MADKITRSDYFQPGETFVIGNPSFFCGRISSSGTNATGTVYLPKKIPAGVTVAASGAISGLFIGSSAYAPTSFDVNAIPNSNSVNITCHGFSAPVSTVCTIATGAITLTFS